jgi:hypothetical protein
MFQKEVLKLQNWRITLSKLYFQNYFQLLSIYNEILTLLLVNNEMLCLVKRASRTWMIKNNCISYKAN